MNDYKRLAAEYRRRIIEMIEKMENVIFLKRIYQLTEYLYTHKERMSLSMTLINHSFGTLSSFVIEIRRY
ncbi:MAG: hypothetical protein K2N01_02980 [Lachnospiraceae bacterium]|nr:hypothetical protein [Lachnospiraceae bacterium]